MSEMKAVAVIVALGLAAATAPGQELIVDPLRIPAGGAAELVVHLSRPGSEAEFRVPLAAQVDLHIPPGIEVRRRSDRENGADCTPEPAINRPDSGFVIRDGGRGVRAMIMVYDERITDPLPLPSPLFRCWVEAPLALPGEYEIGCSNALLGLGPLTDPQRLSVPCAGGTVVVEPSWCRGDQNGDGLVMVNDAVDVIRQALEGCR